MEFLRMTAAEYREKVSGVKKNFTTAKESKYHAKKVEIEGVLFDSKKEAQVWARLQNLQRMGVISELQRQVRFELVPKQKDERAVHYVADYVFKEGDKLVVGGF